jgi:hypothetical protein
MQTITASAPVIASSQPRATAPRLATPTRWLITAAAAAAVALSGLTVLLNAVEASETAEYAAAHPTATASAAR